MASSLKNCPYISALLIVRTELRSAVVLFRAFAVNILPHQFQQMIFQPFSFRKFTSLSILLVLLEFLGTNSVLVFSSFRFCRLKGSVLLPLCSLISGRSICPLIFVQFLER